MTYLPGGAQELADQETSSRSRSAGRWGYGLVIAGAVAFIICTFLPFNSLTFQTAGNAPETISLFQRQVSPGFPGSESLAVTSASAVLLYGGVLAVLIVAIAAMLGRRGWTRVALTGAVVVWAMQWGGSLVILGEITGRPPTKLAFGYWCLVGSLALVIVGTILVARSPRATTVSISG